MITIPMTLIMAKNTGIDHSDPIYNLATTIVEECNKEDTGVGLSIAIGNQYEPNHVALLARIATKNHRGLQILININIRTKSPNRLYITAATEADKAWDRLQ